MCVLADKAATKIGLPALVLFMVVGMFFGVDGPFHVAYDDYTLTEAICSASLIFIMFYGGFNLKWKYARKIWPEAVSLSTIGVVITVGLTTAALHFVLGLKLIEAYMISAVLGSTDAASIFSILRREKLNLKYDTASLLEVESGSNDPVSYMMTFIGIQFFLHGSADHIVLQIITQLAGGLICGYLGALATTFIFGKTSLVSKDVCTLTLVGMVLLTYGVADQIGANAYLAVYLMGILTGNGKIRYKGELISFFDGMTTIAQVMIFFFLGLLSTPSQLFSLLPLSLFVFAAMLVVARPLAVWLLMSLFHAPRPQILLVSFAGLRGAASCVFAVMAVSSGVVLQQNLFQIVFVVCLLSVTLQGLFFAPLSKKLQMVDYSGDVGKTFNDYAEESALTLLRVVITDSHPWAGKQIRDIEFAPGSLALMVLRDKTVLACSGMVQLHPGDVIVLSIAPYESDENESLRELSITPGHPWVNQKISSLNLSANTLIAMILRDEETIIPAGQTEILCGDRVVVIQDSVYKPNA